MTASAADVGPIATALILAVAAVAAVMDWRTGTIPNWLTLPAIAAGLALHAVALGLDGVLASLVGILVCGLVPYLLFRMQAMGGGDVKLLAALGALGGMTLGLEAQMFALAAAACWAAAQLARAGKLRGALANAMRLAVAPVTPRRWRRPIAREAMTSMRLGAPIFVGSTLAVLAHYAQGGP